MSRKLVKADWKGRTRRRNTRKMAVREVLRTMRGKGVVSMDALKRAVRASLVMRRGRKYLDLELTFL